MSAHIVRIPLNLQGLEQFGCQTVDDLTVLGIPLGGEHYEITFGRLPSRSHTAPTEPGGPATPQEIADLVFRLWIAMNAFPGPAARKGYRADAMKPGYSTKRQPSTTSAP